LTAVIAASDIASSGTAQVAVVSPTPGGGTSSSVTFTIGNAVPVVTSLNPATALAGSAAFELTVNGSAFVSVTQVKSAIAAVDVANPISVPITVTNPAPNGASSNALVFVVTTPPAPGVPVPVTVAPDGSPPDGPSLGRHAIFASKASNLVSGDMNGAWGVFVRDTCMDYWTGDLLSGCTPKTLRISVAPDGTQANGDSGSTVTSPSGSLAVSFDGRYVAFVSSATNLVAGDTNGADDVFLRDTCLDDRFGSIAGCTPGTVRVSLRDNGSQSNLPASAPAVGVDGGHVVFVSPDPSIVTGDGNGVADLFLRDVCPGAVSSCTPGTRRISVGPGGADADGLSGSPVFTGRYVAFTSAATNLVAGDSNGAVDVFMRDTCIGAEAVCTPAAERISLGTDGLQANGASSEPLVGLPMGSMSGYDYHGRFVVFVSSATNLVTGDTNGVEDVFIRGVCHDTTTCVTTTARLSVGEQGAAGQRRQLCAARESRCLDRAELGDVRFECDQPLAGQCAEPIQRCDLLDVEVLTVRGTA